ncbi:hypothetical protein ACFOGI_00215 [Virgibacillus xinjiangensis]|uniref:Uncharacterized protein n=1 Tax=Virgibacillus xinjiangensis TaxID=393090 RepID=A0ABV7CQI2_9BACI
MWGCISAAQAGYQRVRGDIRCSGWISPAAPIYPPLTPHIAWCSGLSAAQAGYR